MEVSRDIIGDQYALISFPLQQIPIARHPAQLQGWKT